MSLYLADFNLAACEFVRFHWIAISKIPEKFLKFSFFFFFGIRENLKIEIKVRQFQNHTNLESPVISFEYSSESKFSEPTKFSKIFY